MDITTPEGLEEAKAWIHAVINQIKPGGSWIVPRSGSIYTINHGTKSVSRTGLLPDPGIDYVLRQMGWTVYDPRQN